jgi:hypothetical protein
MLDIPLQLPVVTYNIPSVSASKGKVKEEQTLHLVYVTEYLVEGDFNPK